jgi:hypothetical protein
MAGPIQTLSYFARRLIQFEQKFASRPPEKVQEAADLFHSMSEGLDGLLDAFDDHAALEPATATLKAMLPQLENEVHSEIGAPESDKLSHALREALEPGNLQRQLDAPNRDTLVQELDKATILVRALADGLRVKKQ